MIIEGIHLNGFVHEAVCDAIRESGDWYEGPILRAVAARRPTEGVIVDAGGHIGNHSVWWLEHVRPTRVFAFEPMPDTFALLRSNLSCYSHAWALPLALSDEVGIVQILPDEVNRGRSHISQDGTQPVLAIPLDSLDLVGVTLLKIDVEGWQAHVLRGAVRLLSSSHPALWVEDREGVVSETLASLDLDGYRMVDEFSGANYLWEWHV